MKATKTETARTASEVGRGEKSRLELRRRPVADLSERQLEDAAGGHQTCEPTCPQTCCRTCPNTCDGPTCEHTCDPMRCEPTYYGPTCPEGICGTN